MPTIEFWYEFASSYSYLSAMRIEALATARGVGVMWKPFLLGPIFRAQGWDNSPFNLYPAKGRYMVRDMERLCAARGLPFIMPSRFPQNGLLAARLAILGAVEGWGPDFTRAVYLAEFRDGADISSPAALRQALAGAGQDPDAVLQRAGDQRVKDALRLQTEQARERGIFGAPSFFAADGELFWGDDRLEQALDWAVRGGH